MGVRQTATLDIHTRAAPGMFPLYRLCEENHFMPRELGAFLS